MAKVKAVVMAHRNKYKNALVYTEDGQYLTTRLQPIPPVGSTVYVKPPALIAKPKMLAVAAAVFLILFTGLIPNFAPTPVAAAAYVNLVWQPEIGLWVDEEGKVTQANLVGLPEEEENFATTLKGQDLYTALDQLLQYSREQGTLNNKQTLVIGTLVKTDEQKLPHLTEQELQDFLHSQLAKQGYQGAVLVTSQPQEMLQAAEKAGMPLGKYTVYEKCRQQNQPIKLDLLKQQDVPTALTKSGVKASDVFGQHYLEFEGHMQNQNQESPMEQGTMMPHPMEHQQSTTPATNPSTGASGQTQMHGNQGTLNHPVMPGSSNSDTSPHTDPTQEGHMRMNRHN